MTPRVAAAAEFARHGRGRFPAVDGTGRRRLGRYRLPAVALAAALTAACGSGGEADRVSEGATTTTTTATTTTTPEENPAAAPAVTTAPTAVGRPAATAPTTTTTAVRSAPAPGLTFTTPGNYRYASTGRFTTSLGTQERNGEVVLTVDPPSGTDQRSVRTGFGRTTEQVLRLAGDDALLVSLRLADQGLDKEVRPNPPGLALPADAAPGRSWSWRAVSTDGRTTVDSAFKVLRTEDVTVGGERVPAIVVEVTLTLAGDVTSTSKQTLWVSTARRLVVRQDDVTQGNLGLITFSGTSTDTLISLAPY